MKIIAIDDNKDNLITLKAIIKDSFHDADVITTTSGKQGIEFAQSIDPDVIILDIIMPGMDGHEVCQILKSNEQTQDIPIIFLTALSENKENRLKALEVGGDAFLSKPFDESELIAQIKAMSKLKYYSDQKKLEKINLERTVHEKTKELQQTHIATLNLLEDLREENESRKRKEYELIESENSFRSLFEDSPIAIFEEDFSETILWIQSYKDQGVTNFRNFFQENPEKLLECVHTVKILNVNRSAVDLFNAKGKQELFLSLPSMTYVEDAQDRLDEFVNISEGKTHFLLEIINNTLDKSRKYLSLHWGVVRGYEDDCSKVIVSLVDITDRKLSEMALKESETRFRMLFENSPVSIWEEDFSEVKKYLDQLKATGVEDIKEYFSNNQSEVVKVANLIVVSNVNQETLRIYGATSKEDLKHSICMIFTKKSLDQFVHLLMEISTGKTHFDFDFTNKTIDGRVLEFTAKWAAVPGYENDLSKIITSMIDITDRKLAEEALRENEKRYRSLFDDSPVAIFEEDFSAAKRYIDAIREKGITDFREYFTNNLEELTACVEAVIVTDVNQASLKLFGAETKEQLKTQLNKVIPPEDPLLLLEEFVNIANGLTQFELETVNKTLDGKCLVLSVRWAAAPGYADDLSKVILSVIDITERNLAAEQQRQRIAQMEAMDKITSALRMARSVDEALPIVLKESLAFLGLGVGSIWLYEKNSKKLKIATAIGWLGEIEKANLQPGEGIVGKVFSSGNPIVSANFMQEASIDLVPIEQIPEGYGGACVPIHSLDEIIGVIFVASLQPREIQSEEIKFLEALARIAGITLQRMTLHEETVSHLQQLQAQRLIDQTIASIFDLDLTLDIICTQVRNHLNADAAGVLLYTPNQLEMKYAAGNGFRSAGYQRSRVRLGTGYSGKAALDQNTIFVKNINDSDSFFYRLPLISEDQFITFITTPLIAKGEIKGVLEVFYRSEYEIQPTQKEFLVSLGLQTAIAIDNLQLFEDLQHSNMELVLAYDATIEGWSRAMDLRDKETENHTLRVTEMTVQMARKLGLSDEEVVNMRRGALLHDIGKMGVPDEILHKPGKLTPEEWVIMIQHPKFAYEMIAPIEYLKPALEIPYCHHEKWDGTGYPRSLKGDQIPLAGRVFAVIDVWDALRSDRPYRKAWPEEKVLAYIKEQSGTHFEPAIVDLFLEIVNDNGEEQE